MSLSILQVAELREGVRDALERSRPILRDAAKRRDVSAIDECIQLAYVQGWLDAKGIPVSDELLGHVLASKPERS